MRPLTEEEMKTMFEKLAKYIGQNISHLIEGKLVFRYHRDRVYLVSEELMRKATNISRDHLASLGTCFGKFSKSGKFRLAITSLEYLAPYAQYKCWIKASGEMSFLYGNHILKAHLSRISDDVGEYCGVVVFNMADIPLGFGVAARAVLDTKKLEPTGIVVFHQADVGEYLRDEDSLL